MEDWTKSKMSLSKRSMPPVCVKTLLAEPALQMGLQAWCLRPRAACPPGRLRQHALLLPVRPQPSRPLTIHACVLYAMVPAVPPLTAAGPIKPERLIKKHLIDICSFSAQRLED